MIKTLIRIKMNKVKKIVKREFVEFVMMTNLTKNYCLLVNVLEVFDGFITLVYKNG